MIYQSNQQFDAGVLYQNNRLFWLKRRIGGERAKLKPFEDVECLDEANLKLRLR